ncbi:TRAP transporter small permease [Castellaniella sp.]|uniref:TRAP transporter small permease n=1 Tax=Castellaniella sp. TaxID=1955812 RepID=UPI00355FD46C
MHLLLRDAEKIICAVIFSLMTILGFVNVVVRYVTNYSFASTEEILVNGFLLLTVFGAAIAARSGEHLAVTLVYDLLPGRPRKFVLAVSIVLSCILLLLSAWFSAELVFNQISSGIRSYALQIPAWYYSIGVPFAFLLVLVRFLQHSVEMWRALDQEIQHV